MHFNELSEFQLLALAVTAEEEDTHIYRDFAESLQEEFPASSALFEKWRWKRTGTVTA